jgi:hypothetical protein
MGEFIDAVRAGLVCDRCGKYIGSLARKKYLPAPYPVALGKITAQDEAEALVGFEWYMLQLLEAGKFALRHPQQDGHCVTFREWVASDDGEEDDYDEEEDDELADEAT